MLNMMCYLTRYMGRLSIIFSTKTHRSEMMHVNINYKITTPYGDVFIEQRETK